MLALIDGDIVRYRCGFASMTAPEDVACLRADEMMQGILTALNATEYKVFLSDTLANNFRLQFDPQYKANRENQPKPTHHEALGLFLKQEWDAQVTIGQEADDALGIHQEYFNQKLLDGQDDESCICSIDKDLLQIPGYHFNFVKNEFTTVNYNAGLKHFYSQLLIGDRTDNIFGINGIGPVKTAKLFSTSMEEQQLFCICRGLYEDDERLLRNGRLLWIRRREGEDWKEHYERLMDDTN